MDQKEVWNTLADSWTNLRVRPYPEVIEFSKKWSNGPVLDIGCGNCRNLIPFLEKGKKCVGLDFSEKMGDMARKFLEKRGYSAQIKVSDMVNLPFENESIGTVICNSTLQSITKKDDRVKALYEIKRVMKKDSRILLSTWNRYQKRFYLKIIGSLFRKNKFDVWVDWNYHGKTYKRFYHLYSRKEIENELKFVGLDIEKVWLSKGNIWVIVRK